MVTFWRLPEGSDAVRWARLGNKPRTLLLRELAVLLAAISSVLVKLLMIKRMVTEFSSFSVAS